MVKKEKEIPLNEIEFLPSILKDSLKKSGITSLREFQFKALTIGLQKKNLVISAPTGSGKTLISEMLTVLRVLRERKKGLFLVPYKALAEELKESLTQRYPFIRIGISTGDYREIPIRRLGHEFDLIIVTYEKADMIRRENPPWLREVGIITIDEIHLLSDAERGALLDAVATKFKQLGLQIIALSATIPNANEIASWLDAELVTSDYRPVKLLEGVYLPKRKRLYFYDPDPSDSEIITINSSQEIKDTEGVQINLDNFVTTDQKLLESQLKEIFGESIEITSLHESNIRVVTRQFVKDEITDEITNLLRARGLKGIIVCESIIKPPIKERDYVGYLFDLVYDLLSRARKYNTTWQVLIFRRSRRLAQSTALKLASFFEKTKLSLLFPRARKIAQELISIDEPSPLTEELASVVSKGVAFHHAGLTLEERRIIEKAFRNREIGVIVATPTLGAGINLPARRVIIEHYIYDPLYGRQRITVSQYKQRGGRAGRPGLDQVGEALLIARSKEELFNLFTQYVFGNVENIRSALGFNIATIREQLLAFIVSSHDNKVSLETVKEFFRNTFYFWQSRIYNDYYAEMVLNENIQKGLQDLLSWGFITRISHGQKFEFKATKIGKKVSQLYLNPHTAREILNILEKWKKSLKKQRKINIPTFLTEILLGISKTPDIFHFKMRLMSQLSTLARFIIQLPPSIFSALRSIIPQSAFDTLKMITTDVYLEMSSSEEELVGSLGIVSLLLLWINGCPLRKILSPFSPNFSGGDFRELIRLYEWLLYCTRELAVTVGLKENIVKHIEILRKRVKHGVTEDLLEIVEIPGIGRVRANILKKYGYTSLDKLAKASISALENIPGIGERLARRIIEYAKKKSLL